MDAPSLLIKEALDQVVKSVNSGTRPTDALRKVATEFDLNPNFIQRTGEALNVALHFNHFKTASDRSQEFEIADIPAVVEALFATPEKTAQQERSEQFADLDLPTHMPNYRRLMGSSLVHKQAHLDFLASQEIDEPLAPSFKQVHKVASEFVRDLNKQAAELEADVNEAGMQYGDKFFRLGQVFQKDAAARTSFEEFESQVFANHKEAAIPFIDLLHSTYCPHEERGVHDPHYFNFDTCKEAQQFEQFLKTAEEFNRLTVALVDLKKEASEHTATMAALNAQIEKTAKKLPVDQDIEDCCIKEPKHDESKESAKEEAAESPKEQEAEEEEYEDDPVMALVKKKAKGKLTESDEDPVLKLALEKEAFLGGLLGLSSAKDVVNHTMGSQDIMGEAFKHTFMKPPSTNTGPRPNIQMDNMERQLMLQELMLTDSILSHLPPVRVAKAYEQLIRLSPELSKEKELVRAELRAMTASQALSKFDAELMTKFDMGMLKRRVATQEFNRGNTANFKI